MWDIQCHGIYLGASLASMATSSPMAVWMMTSVERLVRFQIYSQKIIGLRDALTDVLLLLAEHLDDARTELVVRDLDIVLGVTVILHQGEEVIVGDVKLRRTKQVSLCAQEGEGEAG